MTRELTDAEFKAHLNAFAECDIEGGTAAKDRLLFRAGFIAGLDYQRGIVNQAGKFNEPCPVCGSDATVEHGALGQAGLFVHLWDCPECGKSAPTVGYDCQVCKVIDTIRIGGK